MSIWSKLFGAPEVISKGVDAVINAGDALVFTEEEKSRANQKILDFTLRYVTATSGQNIARRLIAIMVVGVWTVFSVGAFILAIWSGFSTAPGPENALEELIGVMDALVSDPVSIVMAFYFAIGAVRTWVNKNGS
jgi:hypothetical protein